MSMTDIREICLEEIALEGLEGITLPTLWLRLDNREPRLPYKITAPLKEFLWKFIVQHKSLEICQIPADRGEPQIFDRFEGQVHTTIPLSHAPDELGTLVEVYATTPVVDAKNVRGACSNFHQRVDIKDDIASQSCTLTESLKLYGERRLVIVASQSLREKTLLSRNLIPIVFSDLTETAYCVLERVGRSRWQGELQSVLGKQNFGEKANHIHYIVDNLQRHGLVVKKNHTYRRADRNKNFFQVLVLLTKYERDCMSFSARTLQNITEILKAAPEHTENLGKLRERSQLDERAFKTVCRTLQKTGDAIVRPITPGKHAKTLYQKVITLVDKTIDIEVLNVDDDDGDIQNLFAESLSLRPLVLERPLVYQSYHFVLTKGSKGVVQRDVLGFLKGFGRLEARNVCKTLGRMNLVNIVLVDHGKQRMQTFIPKNLSSISARTLEFSDEKKKMQQLLVQTTKIASDKEEASAEEQQNKTIDSINTSCDLSFSQNADTDVSLNDISMVVAAEISTSQTEKISNELRADRLNCILQGEYATNQTHLKKWDAHLTTRKIKRHNIILEQLNEEKIIEGYTSLQKTLSALEEQEGVTTKIDKKTIVRLVDKMHYEGVIQHSMIPITHNDRTENIHFIMALDCPQELLKHAVEQARFKLLGNEENRIARLEQEKLKIEMREERRLKKQQEDSLLDPKFQDKYISTSDEKLAIKFFQPKYKRLRIIHNFLWYLAYGHSEIVNWTPEMGIVDPDEVKTYRDEMTWKRFLPPAPIHFQDGLKWLQLGDIAILLPLSIFCQFHRVTFKLDDLEHYLDDEENRHMLVRHLPQDIRTYLFYRRKYMFSLMVCIEQLAFMGLITMRRGRSGRNVNMPKENMLIYVHKNISLLDTRTSMKRHIKVEEKRYERLKFCLNDHTAVEAYWYKLQDVCVQTRLGFSEFQEADYEIIKDHLGINELKKFIQNITETQPKPTDDGEIPGDQRGAAGLDSSMFSYLYRNWRSKTHHRAMDYRIKSQGANMATRPNRLPKLREKNLTLPHAKKKSDISKSGMPLLAVERDFLAAQSDLAVSSEPPTEIGHSKRRKRKKKEEKTLKKGSKDSKTRTRDSDIPPSAESGNKKRRKSDSGKGNDSKKTKTAAKHAENVKKKTKDDMQPEIVTVNNIGRNERVRGGKGFKRKKDPENLESTSVEVLKRKQDPVTLDIPAKKLRVDSRKPRTTKPKTKIVKQGQQKIKYVDKHDLEAIECRKGRRRVHFTKAEDSLLLICHVATSLMTNLYWKKQHRPRKQVISWLTVRDVIQEQLPESMDKTSYSMNRRSLNLMKNSETRICHDISVADTNADGEFLRRHLPDNLDLEKDYDQAEILFRELVRHLQGRFRTKPGLFLKEIPDSNAEVLRLFTPKTILRKIGEKQRKRRHFRDQVIQRNDITRAVAENMTYIALTMEDAEFSVYQAYRAFETFPESILSEVFVLMQVSGTVSSKPNKVRRLPFGIRSHRLAFAFIHTLKASTPHETIDQVSKILGQTGELKPDTETTTPGQIFLMSYLMAKGSVNLSIAIPDEVILPEARHRMFFENQFLAMLQKSKGDIMKEIDGAGLSSTETTTTSVPPTSLMAAAACIFRDNLDDEAGPGTSNGVAPKDTEADDPKLKLAEVFKLYNRHPSYTNWLLLISANRRNETSESKFANSNVDYVVLSPCAITVENTQELLKKYSGSEQSIQNINKMLMSSKINQKKSEENWDRYLKEPSVESQNFILKTIFEIVDESAEWGMTKTEISDSVDFGFWTVGSGLRELRKQKILYSVGVTEKRYVTYKHAKAWAAKGFHFCGEDESFQSEISFEIALLKKFNSDKTDDTTDGGKDSGLPDLEGEPVVLPAEASKTVMNRYKEVEFICRPWHTIYGDVSSRTAKQLILSVFLKVSSCPGITKDDLLGSFTFQPICVIELLGILQEVGCITEHVFETPGVKRMFCAPSPPKKITYYEATQDGMITVSQWSEIATKSIGKAMSMSPTQQK